MPIEILMPALSPTMTEGNLAKWHKKEGDPVKAGDVLAEIETDKATMEVEAVEEGTLGKIVVPEGAQAVKVNDVIALLLEEGEDKSALAGGGKKAAASPPPPARSVPPAGPTPKTEPAPAPRAPAPSSSGNGHAGGERVFASPLARRMAEQAGLDLNRVKGSGPQGRIVKADIEGAVSQGGAKQAPAATPPAARAPGGAPAAMPSVGGAAPSFARDRVVALAGNIPHTEVPHTGMRKTIARRMVESKQNVPHFNLTVDCNIDNLLKLRADLNAKSEKVKISVNDFVIHAAALTLRKMPASNASYSDEAILRWNTVDISVAVAIPDGLITPIIKNADQKGLATIAAEMKDLAQRARDGKLKLEEFQGGTFSISNLGMYGIKEFTAVINPPQGAILAVGAGEQRPVVKNGALAIATVMSCTLACDHRVIDGATGAQWISEFKKLIEDPITMLL
jgi:pyruvate dehydrogenase E2 component (dihydrolipoamide acetyltransferase)